MYGVRLCIEPGVDGPQLRRGHDGRPSLRAER